MEAAPGRYVISGLSRLTVRVARTLLERGADVVVVAEREERQLASLLGDSIRAKPPVLARVRVMGGVDIKELPGSAIPRGGFAIPRRQASDAGEVRENSLAWAPDALVDEFP